MMLTEKCQNKNCKNTFFRFSKNVVEAEVNLDETINHYFYCSEKCFIETLDKLNSTAVPFEPILKIEYKEKVSETPSKWLVMCTAEYPDIKMI